MTEQPPAAGRVTVGIDIGGTGTKGAPVDTSTGQLTAPRVRLLTPHPATPAAVADTVAELVDQLGVPGSLGITLPAVVQHGIARSAANIDEGWIDTDAVDLFSRATGRNVAVVNDADAAGVAEVRFGAGRDVAGVLVLLTFGTGIGSAVFVDGELVPNTELGHLHLHGGDAERYAAASVREDEQLSWEKWARRVERYLRLVEDLLWPDLIVVGGGVSKHAEKFLPLVETRTTVVTAQMHNDAGIAGAALFAPPD